MSTQAKPRPVIGIPCSSYPDSWFTPANGNAVSYLRVVEAVGGIPALIHQTRDAEVLAAHYARCDALLLAGGEDVGPAHYGAAPHPRLGPTNPLQDENEIALVRRALADAKPVLAICRGVQLLNVALGGSLIQDLPSERPDGLNHSRSTDQRDMSFLAHPVALAEDSWLAERLGARELLVNSLHHQAIERLAAGLRVVGRAPDGVIEAVEGTGPGFVLGVQCHPEELWERADPRWAGVFAAFVALAAKA
ncbi:MAG TPA: gamma-glutamyl-gamma-aminobutyrate hydrolase family protein [Kouleothrix sp.]|uniref:gamma-glutamyl-gamma-aminobutyrate hydrolase family protein n=1 Tax=Kouleothrix sp. TaxID=2779161 RepID=UPI002CC8527B|nr:gamma-glutamyl-gamma-aminobutyrate hydrolase family protein [Kouleothrix sp.]HRC76303.1 gamma-glutamyl-gamma-aminobutyrate hydrolase family protein [Kouleothrix sp.]